MSNTPLTIWAISDGRAGMENQALGLAEAIARQRDAQIVRKRITITRPFDQLPRWLWGDPLKRLAPDSDSLSPPWPDVWIACGRRTVPLTMAVSGKGPFTVQTQDPRAPLDKFDLVLPPHHDELAGDNVFPLTGAPNRLTEDAIAQAAQALSAAMPPLPRPLAAALIGGPSKDYRLTESVADKIIETLAQKIADGYGLLITTSRRTPEHLYRRLAAELPAQSCWVWDGQPIGSLTNPYFGLLGIAQHILVTEESTNMITDAAFTGKPITLLPLDGGAPKWQRFHGALSSSGVFSGDPEAPYPPLRETDRVAAEILSRHESSA